MQKQPVNRWRLVAVVLTCLTFFGALSVFQSAMAQGEPEAVAALRPPFHFQTDDRAAATAAFPPVPLTARRLLTETFDSFTPSTSGTGTFPEWRVFTDTGSADYGYWNRVTAPLSPAYANTAWASCGNCVDASPGQYLDPDTDNYLPNQGAWMIYGPVTLTDYYGAEVTFNYRLDVRTGDSFWFGISTDGTNFAGSPVPYAGNVTTSNWLTHTFNMGNFAGKGKPSLYLGFYFHSNDDGNTGKGAFVDNVILRAAPYVYTFMPLVPRYFSIAPPYLYNFTWDLCFSNPDPDCQNRDVDFWQWGGPAGAGDPRVWEQNYADGNPGYGMYVYNTRTALTTMSGPNLGIASANYEISAEFYVYKSKRDARYGLIFGADNATFGKDSQGLLTFNADTNYYKFVLAFPDVTNFGNVPTRWRLEHCNGSATNCAKVIDFQNMPSAAGADGVWDKLTVRRMNGVITLLVNDYPLPLSSVTDTYGGGSEFGMFISSTSYNDAPPKNPLEIDYDNYRVIALP